MSTMPTTPMKRRVGGLHWTIAILLGVGVVINYLDRTNIAAAATSLEHDYHLSSLQYGIYAALFWFTYRDPGESKRLSLEEREYITQGGAQQNNVTPVNFWAAFTYLMLLGRIEQLPAPFAETTERGGPTRGEDRVA